MVEGVVDVKVRLLLLLLLLLLLPSYNNATGHSDVGRSLPAVAAAHAATQYQGDGNHENDGEHLRQE